MAPVIAGIVISKRAWDKVPDRYKEEMIEAAEEVARNLARETEALERQAMDVMLDNGLIVHDVPGSAASQWRDEFVEGLDMIKGDAFSVEIYERVRELLNQYRR